MAIRVDDTVSQPLARQRQRSQLQVTASFSGHRQCVHVRGRQTVDRTLLLAAYVFFGAFATSGKVGGIHTGQYDSYSTSSSSLKVCLLHFGLDGKSLQFRNPAMDLPSFASVLLATRDIRTRNCAMVHDCEARLQSSFTGGITMNYTDLFYYDVNGLDVTAIPRSITECGENGGDIVIGPPTSAQTAFAAYVAAAYDTAVISPSASAPSLSNKDLYPTAARVSPSSRFGTLGIGGFIKTMGWRQVAVFHSSDSFGSGVLEVLHESMLAGDFSEEQQSADDLVTLHSVPVREDFTQGAFNDAVEELRRTGAKVIVLVIYSHALPQFITAIQAAGLDLSTYTVVIGGAYLETMISALADSSAVEGNMLADIEGWLGVDYSWDADLAREWNDYLMGYMTGDEFPRDAAAAFVRPRGTGGHEDNPDTTEVAAAEFSDRVKALVSEWKEVVVTSQTWFSPQTYDAVWLGALAAAQALPGEEGLGRRAIQALRDGRVLPFSGATVRRWSWDSNADPEIKCFRLKVNNYSRQPGDDSPKVHTVAYFSAEDGRFTFSSDATLVWSDGTTYPQSIPTDGLASSGNGHAVLILTLSAVGALSIAVLALLIYVTRRNMKLKQLLDYHNVDKANKLDLETPAAKLYAFLEKVRKGSRFSTDEVAKLQTLLVTSKNLRAPDISVDLQGVQQYTSGFADFLVSTCQAQSRDVISSRSTSRTQTSIDTLPAPRDDRDSLETASLEEYLASWSAFKDDPRAQQLQAGLGLDLLQDTFALQELSSNKPLTAACTQIASRLQLDKAVLPSRRTSEHAGRADSSAISMDRFYAFISVIEAGYNDVPYHNATHAADVTCRFVALMEAMGVFQDLQKSASRRRHVVAMIVAAAVHDYAHPGTNNAFQVRSRSPVARSFNDQHVLEMLSIREALSLLDQREDLNFIKHWTVQEQMAFRETVIEMILATDMSRHFEILGTFSSTVSRAEASTSHPVAGKHGHLLPTPGKLKSKSFYSMDESSRAISLRVALKIADIGHSMTPFQIHHQWSQCLEDEFFLQGDLERKHSIPISPLMDRTLPGVNYPSNQIGFMDCIVLPLLDAFVGVFPSSRLLLETAEANRLEWQKRRGLEDESASG